MQHARHACAAQNLHLTPAREFVLSVLLEEHRAMGAYEILNRLKSADLGSQPPIAYRALEFLTAHGFAHKIERLNAFVACTHQHGSHTPAFFICTGCGTVAETAIPALGDPISPVAQSIGFHVARMTLEAEGHCQNCHEAAQ
jgi:Fur family zinc uptake transcriptional regulator